MEIKSFPCEQCGNSWDDARAVRNNLVLDNGANSVFRDSLCDGCAKDIHDYIESRKQELKLKVRKYEEVKAK